VYNKNMANYIIKSGDTLSKIAAANKTDIATLQKLNPNITDINKIYAGANLNLPDVAPITPMAPYNPQTQMRDPVTGQIFDKPVAPAPPAPAPVSPAMPKEGDTRIFADQNQVFKNGNWTVETSILTKEDAAKKLLNLSMNPEPEGVRKSVEADNAFTAALKGILETKAPTAPKTTETYQQQKELAGLPQLENDYNTAQSDLRALENEIVSKKEQIQGQAGVSSRYINRKLVKLDADTSEALRVAEQKVRDIATQVDTKNKTVSLLMDFAKTDYSNAVSNYEFQYNKAIQIYSLYSQQQDKITNNAQASLKVIQDSIKDGSIDSASLTSYQKQVIQNLEVQAGEPIGITEFLQSNVKEKVFWKGVETDEAGNKVLMVIPEKADGTADMGNMYKVVVGTGTEGKTPENIIGGDTLTTNLNKVGIPPSVATTSGKLEQGYKDKMMDAGLLPSVIDGIWQNIVNGNTFEEIRQGIRSQGGDPAVLDVFVQVLQKQGGEQGISNPFS
jgi:hypothetical protein